MTSTYLILSDITTARATVDNVDLGATTSDDVQSYARACRERLDGGDVDKGSQGAIMLDNLLRLIESADPNALVA